MDGEMDDRARTRAQVKRALGPLTDLAEGGVETDHPYADTLSDSTLPSAQPGPSMAHPPATPSLDSISNSNHAEDLGDACTLKEILQMQVKLLEQLIAGRQPPPSHS